MDESFECLVQIVLRRRTINNSDSYCMYQVWKWFVKQLSPDIYNNYLNCLLSDISAQFGQFGDTQETNPLHVNMYDLCSFYNRTIN